LSTLDQHRRVTCVIASLGFGGAQRVLVNMVNHWAGTGRYDITLLVLEAEASPAYAVAPAVRVRWLGLTGFTSGLVDKIATNVRRVRMLRRACRESGADMVIAFQDETNVMTLLGLAWTGIPVICSERIHPAHHTIGAFWNWLRPKLYPRARAVVVQSADIARWFSKEVKTVVIPNPVFAPEADRGSGESGGRKILLAAGRLHHQKGFDLLLEAFADVSGKYPGWELRIVGEGEERERLEQEAASLGLGGRVFLPGVTRDMAGEYARADAFVLSSRFEGFPNVLAEAMAYGLPVVAADCPGAVSDMIRDGVDGLLAVSGDVAAMAGKLDAVMGSVALRHRLGDEARKIVDRFSERRVMALWEALIDGAGEGGRGQ